MSTNSRVEPLPYEQASRKSNPLLLAAHETLGERSRGSSDQIHEDNCVPLSRVQEMGCEHRPERVILFRRS
jgi:hypothetical protein